MTDLATIPGIGSCMAQRLKSIDYHCVEDLVNADPEEIFEQDHAFQKRRINRNARYRYRLAVAYAEGRITDPELLKWWNWADLQI